jgi:hypothetical protein
MTSIAAVGSWRPFAKTSVALAILVAAAGTQSLSGQAAPAAAGLAVEVGGRTVTLSAARLATLPRDTMRGRIHDAEHRFAGPRLAAVLAEAGVSVSGLRGGGLTRAVVVEATDGYQMVLSIGELDSTLVARRAILADEEDGRPLAPKFGPRQLILEGESRPTRWVRQVTRLRVVELGTGGGDRGP